MNYFKDKNLLMVMAHPDDEVIFGWPILQNQKIKKSILICSSDLNNPDRQWCSHRKFAFAKLCDSLEIPYDCLDYNSEFYRLETRNGSLSRMIDGVLERINKFEFDIIYTHNAWGEYGHLDHQLIHNIVASVGVPTVVSDIYVQSNWVPYKHIPAIFERLYCRNLIEQCVNNLVFYNNCHSFYSDVGAWTWCYEPVESCCLYEI